MEQNGIMSNKMECGRTDSNKKEEKRRVWNILEVSRIFDGIKRKVTKTSTHFYRLRHDSMEYAKNSTDKMLFTLKRIEFKKVLLKTSN